MGNSWGVGGGLGRKTGRLADSAILSTSFRFMDSMRMITTLIVHYNISIYIASGASIVHSIEMVITVGCEMMQYAIIGVHYLGFIFDSHAFHLISEYNNDNSHWSSLSRLITYVVC